MKKLIPFCLGLLLANCCFAQNNDNGIQQLTPTQLQQDFTILKSSLQLNHPDLYLYCGKEKMDSLLANIENKLTDEMTNMEFFNLLTPIHALIGNNHTWIMPPKAYVNYIKTKAKRFPFSFYLDRDTLFVAVDGSAEYILKEGAIIETINGVKIKEIYQHLVSNMSADGFNKTAPRLRVALGFSRYYAYHYGIKDAFTITYMDSEKAKHTVNIAAIMQTAITENIKKRSPIKNKQAASKKDFEFSVQDGIGILTIKTFIVTANNKYKSFLKEAFKRIATENIQSLVVDLRGNGGGYPEAADKLLAYLIEAEMYPTKFEYAITKEIHNDQYFEKDDFYKHFKKQNLEQQGDKYHVKGATKRSLQPNKNAFNGKLYVLMDVRSSSTTGHLLGLIKSYTNAIFLGEEPSGNPVTVVASDILTLVLPNSKMMIKLPFIKSELNVNFKNTGRGILPDNFLRPSFAAYLSGRDDVLEETVEWVLKKNHIGVKK